ASGQWRGLLCGGRGAEASGLCDDRDAARTVDAAAPCVLGCLSRSVPEPERTSVPRTIFAFNGDLESRLALHWLVHERGYEVVTVSLNLGQGVYLEPLGEIALDLGATAAQVIDRRELFLRDFALPTLQAGAVYQSSCFLGSALARYVIAQELVRVARDRKSVV